MIVEGYRQKGQPIQLEELKSFLWGAATRLRGQIDAAGYKEYIFPRLRNLQSGFQMELIGKMFVRLRKMSGKGSSKLLSQSNRQIQVRRQMVGLLEVLMVYSVPRMAGRTRQRCRTISSPD